MPVHCGRIAHAATSRVSSCVMVSARRSNNRLSVCHEWWVSGEWRVARHLATSFMRVVCECVVGVGGLLIMKSTDEHSMATRDVSIRFMRPGTPSGFACRPHASPSERGVRGINKAKPHGYEASVTSNEAAIVPRSHQCFAKYQATSSSSSEERHVSVVQVAT